MAKWQARLPGNPGRREDSVGTENERSRRSSCRRPKLPSSEEMSEPGVRHVWLASSHCCMFNFLSGGFVPFAKMFMWDWGRGAKGAPCRYVRPCTCTQPAFEVPRGQRHFSQRLLGLKRGPPEPRRSSLAEGAPSDSPREPSPRCGGPPLPLSRLLLPSGVHCTGAGPHSLLSSLLFLHAAPRCRVFL